MSPEEISEESTVAQEPDPWRTGRMMAAPPPPKWIAMPRDLNDRMAMLGRLLGPWRIVASKPGMVMVSHI